MKFKNVGSVVPASGLSLLLIGSSLALMSCTAQHTAELTRNAASDAGLRSAFIVHRTGSWTLSQTTAVYVAPTEFSRSLGGEFPRLRIEVDRQLNAQLQEQFPHHMRSDVIPLARALADAAARQYGVLFQLGLYQTGENLSSVTEVADGHGLDDAELGRDQLRLALRIYDVQTGLLLDTLTVQSRSGFWRWDEHKVAELIDPALTAIFKQLQTRTGAG